MPLPQTGRSAFLIMIWSFFEIYIYMDNHLIGTVLDRFGTEVTIRKSDEEHFLFQDYVCVGKQFFGWLAGLGEGVRIIGPEKIRKEYTTFLKQALRNNEGRNEDKNNGKIQASGASGKK